MAIHDIRCLSRREIILALAPVPSGIPFTPLSDEKRAALEEAYAYGGNEEANKIEYERDLAEHAEYERMRHRMQQMQKTTSNA